MRSGVPIDLSDRDEFLSRLTALYPKEVDSVLDRFWHEDRYVTYWHNPLIENETETLPGEKVECSPLLKHEERTVITHSSSAENGAIYIQNPSSYFAVECLDVKPDMEVLDLAAAPGGKTIAIAALMANTGRLAAVEPVPRRFHRLRANVARCGVTNVNFYQRDGRSVGRVVPEGFDRVILDAPCSSEARMRWTDPTTYQHWQLRKIKETQRKQKGLIMSAFQALKPGGVMVYCTCSFAPEENESVVAHLLKRTSAELLDIDLPLPASAQNGVTEWRDRKIKGGLEKTVRIRPDEVWNGFFIAKLRKPHS